MKFEVIEPRLTLGSVTSGDFGFSDSKQKEGQVSFNEAEHKTTGFSDVFLSFSRQKFDCILIN